MKELKKKMLLLGIVMTVTALTAMAQSTKPDLPKVDKPKVIGFTYSNDGRGKVLVANKTGRVQQVLEVWENQSKAPTVVTYLLLATDGKAFSVTWGRGPVNLPAFNCKADKIPEFGEKDMWVATMSNGALSFQGVKDQSLKGLFDNLTFARRHLGREVGWENRRHTTNSTESNIIMFLSEKNRKWWLEQGWLQPATECVRHF